MRSVAGCGAADIRRGAKNNAAPKGGAAAPVAVERRSYMYDCSVGIAEYQLIHSILKNMNSVASSSKTVPSS